MSPLWEDAIRRGDVRLVLELLGHHANTRNRYGQTALMLAAQFGHCEIAEVLIAHRADLNITAKFGLSALQLAIIAGHEQVACLIARAGADISITGVGALGFCGKTAYDMAVERGLLELSAELKTG